MTRLKSTTLGSRTHTRVVLLPVLNLYPYRGHLSPGITRTPSRTVTLPSSPPVTDDVGHPWGSIGTGWSHGSFGRHGSRLFPFLDSTQICSVRSRPRPQRPVVCGRTVGRSLLRVGQKVDARHVECRREEPHLRPVPVHEGFVEVVYQVQVEVRRRRFSLRRSVRPRGHLSLRPQR